MKYTLSREVSGYSRGYETLEVEAESEEEALEKAEWMDGDYEETRNDMNADEWSID